MKPDKELDLDMIYQNASSIIDIPNQLNKVIHHSYNLYYNELYEHPEVLQGRTYLPLPSSYLTDIHSWKTRDKEYSFDSEFCRIALFIKEIWPTTFFNEYGNNNIELAIINPCSKEYVFYYPLMSTFLGASLDVIFKYPLSHYNLYVTKDFGNHLITDEELSKNIFDLKHLFPERRFNIINAIPKDSRLEYPKWKFKIIRDRKYWPDTINYSIKDPKKEDTVPNVILYYHSAYANKERIKRQNGIL